LRYKAFTSFNSSRDIVINESTFRQDVVYKSVLRDMKKYYSKDFNEKTRYMKIMRLKAPRTDYISVLRDYILLKFPEKYI
jgi:hypothetical protein